MFLKIKLIFLFVLFHVSVVFSQSIQRFAFVSAAGSSSGLPSLQSGIGELMSNTFISGTILSQGFVQNDQVGNGVHSLEEVLALRAFPNPVTEELTIELNGISGDVSVEVYDVTGRKQFTGAQKFISAAKNTFQLNFGSVVSGIYFVRIVSAENKTSKVFKITKI